MKQKLVTVSVLCLLVILMACSSGGWEPPPDPLPNLPAYTMQVVSGGEVNETNTGSGNTANWGAGNLPGYAKPYTVNAFSIGDTEVTYELWKAVYDWATDAARGLNVYTFANPGRQGGDGASGPVGNNRHPVTTVSWRDAVVWCNAYSEAAGRTPVYYFGGAVLRQSEGDSVTAGNGKADQAVINTGNGYRLPSSAQWEYAARGGVPSTGTPWTHTYAGSNAEDAVAWHSGISGGETHPVKTLAANDLGLYDMSGNMREWCQDPYSGTYRVFRGGSWYDGASGCAVSGWSSYNPSSWRPYLGFRVVCP
jgi:formylglycine-generating enzyme required for sulfatase activity